MNNDNVRSLRLLFNIIPIFAFVAFAGCASTPEEKGPAVEPTAEAAPAPAEEEPAPAPALVTPGQPATPTQTQAAPIVLAPHHPESYVVVKGDTLWDISGRFLRDPWRWPEVWQGNPKVANPHLIYPGDVLMIAMVNGRPVIYKAGQPAGAAVPPAVAPVPTDESGRPLTVVKLHPEVRVIELEKAIPTIPMDAIRQFLERSVVVKDGLDNAPYVVAFADEHISGGTGYRLYARGVKNDGQSKYMVVRGDKEYVDPDTGERLGREALYLAGASLEREGDPATLTLYNAKREVLRGDRLLPGEPETFNYSFMPHAPAKGTKGRIISVFDAINQIGQYQVVALNLGKREGMEQGHVLAVFQDGAKVKDPVKGGTVKLPDERAGTVLIFRVFDKVSYALVMNSVRAIHLNDRVMNP